MIQQVLVLNRLAHSRFCVIVELTVDEAVLVALERNPTVTIQRLNHEIIDTYRR